MSDLKILDCTFRDGGYYNLWDFDAEVVNAYLQSISKANIDYVELGLRNFPKDGFYGAFAYTLDTFLERLDLPAGPTYGVMVNAGDILNSTLSITDAVDCLFRDCSESKVSLVRIAAHFHEVENSGEIARALKSKGYIVGLNLMQSGGKPDKEIAERAAIVNAWQCIDVLYFADSLGNMDAKEVKRIIAALRSKWNGELGIHTHNNMSRAIDNTLIARELGVKWLDVTVTGMGRGAGNAQTENLLAVLAKEDGCKYSPDSVYDLVIRHFEPLQRECGWGSNLLYFLGAQNDIHPTYVQKLLSDSRYGTDEIVGAIAYLSKLEGTTSFSGELLNEALSINESANPASGTSVLKGKFDNKEVLLLGAGSSIEKYLTEIVAYIQEVKPVVVAINIKHPITSDLVDYYCVSHNSKFLAEHALYVSLGKPIIMPKHLFRDDEVSEIAQNISLLDYGISIERGVFQVNDEFCVLPYELTVGYALAAIGNSEARCVSLVGFDGYERGDIRQTEMIELLALVAKSNKIKEVRALTPTTYPVRQGSIYARFG